MNARFKAVLCRILSAAACAIALSHQASGQDENWAKKMFAEVEHDFGIVPRGAKAEYTFKFTNSYEQPLHVAGVRSSCGCTLPKIITRDVKTYQEGEISCEFNTRSFIGSKDAVVTVTFDRPVFTEVQLRVKGNIRSDIVTDPGEIQFGNIDRGSESQQTVRITYAGRNYWEIKDVLSENANLGVSFEGAPTRSRDGRVEYKMKVRLKNSAPVGLLNDQIVLKTNDQNYNFVAIPVRGNVMPPLVVTPPEPIGTIGSGEKWTGRIVLKSKQAFSIREIECKDSRFEFSMPDGKKRLHIIQVQFASKEGTEGAFKTNVRIVSDLEKDAVAETSLIGNVINR